MINENEPPSGLNENIAEAMEENVPMEDEVNILNIFLKWITNLLSRWTRMRTKKIPKNADVSPDENESHHHDLSKKISLNSYNLRNSLFSSSEIVRAHFFPKLRSPQYL